METSKLKTFIQSANINFLFGSGLSKPYLETLGNIEKWLTELSDSTVNDDVCSVIKASIYNEYFTKVMLPNLILTNEPDYKTVIDNYKIFLSTWNDIINKRANRLLSKQINIYTTNIDTLVEKAAEETKIEFNDGFKGSIKPIFDEGNFQKSYNKTSLHFQNTSEIPVFNLLKMHGSLNWSEKDSVLSNDYNLKTVNQINTELQKIESKYFIVCGDLSEMETNAQKIIDDKSLGFNKNIYDLFLQLYDNLIIVNPTKRKFSETVMDIHFYELMRMYSNSLEKENSILFVMGFSFADEHIAKITLRAANTNPTLLVVIFAFNDGQEQEYKENLTLDNNMINNNILVLTPKKLKEANKVDDKEPKKKKIIDSVANFDLGTINSVFELVNYEIPVSYGK
jgi:NAD-dependent SIR2 family protein deacetylase